jgi:hypothetical protein
MVDSVPNHDTPDDLKMTEQKQEEIPLVDKEGGDNNHEHEENKDQEP